MMRRESVAISSLAVHILLLILLVQIGLAVNNPFSYIHGIYGGINDCDVIKYNGEYYITGNWLKGDMLCSRDLESWGKRSHVFSWNNPNGWHTQVNQEDADYDIHGTHIRYLNGIFYLYAHLDVSSGITHATSDNIWGPYIEVTPYAAFSLGRVIDADTFLDEDGSLYYYETNRDGTSGHDIRAKTMSDLSTPTGSWDFQINDSQSWEGSVINEGSKVFKYRGRYYMLYNGKGTGDPDYAVGCVEASTPLGFNNNGKYSDNPVISRAYPTPGAQEITHIGQSWVVEGLNGFEKWFGYFAVTQDEGRTQRIDRMHFFDRHLFIDGPTNRYTTGYHPGPAKPQLLSLFNLSDGPMLTEDWTVLWGSGSWDIASEQARQLTQNSFTFNTVNRDSAAHYLIEANVKFIDPADGEDKCGVLAYYQDDSNWLIVGLDRFNDSWYYHKKENGVDTVSGAGYSGSMDYTVFHKIRVEKNGSDFHVRIDEQIPPSYTGPISTIFSGTGTPGLYADHAATAYDGIIYTIGWDEYDSGITEWDGGALPMVGTWSIASDGLTQSLETAGSKYIFKGDLMPQYEVATQVYKSGSADGSMGFLPVVVDASNYLGVEVNLVTNEVFTYGTYAGAAITSQYASVADATSYNLRAVKLSDRIIIFVDGQEKLTVNLAFGDASVGLICQNMAARYNGIMTYRIEPKSVPAEWTVTDVGAVGFAGTADQSEETLTMTASGVDIWGTADSFNFVHQLRSGDVEITARVVHHGVTDWWQKAGVTIRENLTAGSRHSTVVLAAVNSEGSATNCQRLWRSSPNIATGATDTTIATNNQPYWVRVKRQGSLFTTYRSSDGVTWMQIGSPLTIAMSSDVYVGLVLTAHNNSRITDAVFDNVTIVPTCGIDSSYGDISGDCVVDQIDLEMMAAQWLSSGSPPSADIYPYPDSDLIVNLMDFAAMAANWLECGWIPDTACP